MKTKKNYEHIVANAHNVITITSSHKKYTLTVSHPAIKCIDIDDEDDEFDDEEDDEFLPQEEDDEYDYDEYDYSKEEEYELDEDDEQYSLLSKILRIYNDRRKYLV